MKPLRLSAMLARSMATATRTLFLLCALLAWTISGLAESSEFVRQMNLGKAHLENRNSAKAIEAFAAAVSLEPQSAAAWRNLARAQLLAGRNQEALASLAKARALAPDSVATAYLTGLAHVHESRFEQAVPFFEAAVRHDPHTATLRFQLANAYQLSRDDERALTQYRETVRLDPLHASAQFKLATYARRRGDRAEAERRQREFQRLRALFSDDTRTPAALERCVYTQAEPPEIAPAPAPTAIPVRFTDATPEALRATPVSARAAAVLEVDTNGVCTVLVVGTDGAATLLRSTAEGVFAGTRAVVTLSRRFAVRQCLVGDFHNDVPAGEKYDPEAHARNDVLLLGADGCALLQRTGPVSFQDVTAAAGLSSVRGQGAAWLDYDHDGDLDLLVAADTLQLWQNNGNGTFVDATAAAGLKGATAAAAVAVVDLDTNVAIDLVVARGAQPTQVFLNQRTGQFAPLPEPPGPWPPAGQILADDLDNDGHPDAVLLGGSEALIVYGQRAERPRLQFRGLHDCVGSLVDFDNDGRLDLCVAGAGGVATQAGALRLWRNTGTGWTDVSTELGASALDLPPGRDVLAADFDADGDTDLLLVCVEPGLRFLRNEGGSAHRQLKVQLLGTKTNPAGLGTRIEVRGGDFFAARTVSRLPLEIGLGPLDRLDSVQTVWGNGVVDNQIDVAVSPRPLRILEKNVAAGSCPYLYAWDGERFRFVTDLLGNAPLGLSVRRHAVLPADPEEIVWIGTTENFPPRDGAYEVEITEELREVLYLDEARLIAVDHPPAVEVHPTDKLRPPPFPPSEIWGLTRRRPLVSVIGDDGLDRTAAAREIDGVFAPPGLALPPPLRGQCRPLALVIDFGPLPAAPVLALTGWLQYGDASVNIAASQNPSLPVIPPSLEVETSPGTWAPVDVVVGMPAGKTKTIVCDLTGKLPPGARRLRLTTTFEIRWDRLALFERAPADSLRRRELRPSSAQLRWRGFSDLRARAPGHPPTPNYDAVSAVPPWRTTPQGWCTRYGQVSELVRRRDDQLVLLNGGDALRLRFDARALPPVPNGWQRTFFLLTVGWDKDADPNVVAGDTVEPLPVRLKGDWWWRYSTRWVGGRIAPDVVQAAEAGTSDAE